MPLPLPAWVSDCSHLFTLLLHPILSPPLWTPHKARVILLQCNHVHHSPTCNPPLTAQDSPTWANRAWQSYSYLPLSLVSISFHFEHTALFCSRCFFVDQSLTVQFLWELIISSLPGWLPLIFQISVLISNATLREETLLPPIPQ